MTHAEVIRRTEKPLSQWVRLVEKEVRLDRRPPEIYHCFAQAPYVSVLAVHEQGLIPLVQQFRPAVETYTWELPAGFVEGHESAEVACRRELKEETGLDVHSIVDLGTFYPDTGRLENLSHAFLVRAAGPVPAVSPEPGLDLRFVERAELKELIRTGQFRHQLHLGVLAAAMIAGFSFDER